MASPVVVQGSAVADPYQTTTSTASTGTWQKGEKQTARCNDPLFAVLLYINVGAIAAVAGIYGPGAFATESANVDEYDGYMYAVLVTGVFALAVSGVMMIVMMQIPELLIKISLVFVVVLTGVWAVFAFIQGNIVMGVFGLIFFAVGICYARAVWSRIPFATANLVTAMTAVKKNCGITIIAYVFVAMAFGWSLLWTVALLGVFDSTYDCQEVNGQKICDDPNYGYLFVLFVSYFFTHQVLQNTVHVTVAGVVGEWWFSPENSGCCSTGIINSFIRSMTTSFGSICFGSLLVAVIQALRQLAHQARAEGDAGILACIAECILACIEGIVIYFNKWAYIYVGLYGYPYLEAGKNVFTLFQNRGWDAIIADDLVSNCLFLVSIVTGGISGVVGIVIEQTSDFFDSAAGDATIVSFILGFIVGLVLCSILMSTIASAVNAVIVLFAEAPAEFEQNHPTLSRQMRDAWLGAFPGCL